MSETEALVDGIGHAIDMMWGIKTDRPDIPDEGWGKLHAVMNHLQGVLAERSADEDGPIAIEWSEAVGGEAADRSDRDIVVYKVSRPGSDIFVEWMVGDGVAYLSSLGDEIAVPCNSRGDLRRLCVALGIPLKEKE